MNKNIQTLEDRFVITIGVENFSSKLLVGTIELFKQPDQAPVIDFNRDALYFLVAPLYNLPTAESFGIRFAPQICQLQLSRQLLPADERALECLIGSFPTEAGVKLLDVHAPFTMTEFPAHGLYNQTDVASRRLNPILGMNEISFTSFGTICVGHCNVSNQTLAGFVANNQYWSQCVSATALRQLGFDLDTIPMPFTILERTYDPSLPTLVYWDKEEFPQVFLNALPTKDLGVMSSLPGVFGKFSWTAPAMIFEGNRRDVDWHLTRHQIPFIDLEVTAQSHRRFGYGFRTFQQE